ncbi:hypothetical protein FRACYDRAFT_234625 [Fragilariopsis cylindrus CCMP1102]|uniref:Uncharacterized protein n=1 Tax=Fragilariopsis cylindrus CCMP1102 TaxID=635003 RepID=A0A1E7FT39_9STRA|nr:hypothetical protein FRACYDRAFT_234625 [Fragilariopsis cylindrus CCMP1102]|eukprot:OEU20993.1 hypothetical protein FRACYDRAFT_234625 [Fragilariopsis cylindrus CCMP1102]
MATAGGTNKSRLVTRSLYRNLLRTSKLFTSPSPNAIVLSCLLQRTGIDDHIQDWNKFVAQNNNNDNGDGDYIVAEYKARDLTFSYSDILLPQHQKKEKVEEEKEDSFGIISPSTLSLSSTLSSTSSTPIPTNRTYQRLFRRLLREVVTGTNNYGKMVFPSQVDTTKLRKVIQREFRNGDENTSSTTTSSMYFDEATRRQVAFTTLKELNKKLSYYDKLLKSNPEPIPQQAAWHVSSLPFHPPASYLRPGVFLVSHPYMHDSYFSRTVICILEHKGLGSVLQNTTPPGQTYGVIVNRVSIQNETGQNRTLKEVFREHMLPERLIDTFGDSVVREGGPVHVSLQMIHSLSNPASEQVDVASNVGGTIIPTITDGEESPALYSDRASYFRGNMYKIMSQVEDGKIDRDDVSFFVGASTWSPGQLASEIAQGYWIPCRGPPEMALDGICEHEPTTSGNRPLAELWLSMMSACGEDEAKLSHLFHRDHCDENGLPCDAFDDDDHDDDILF